MVERTNTSSEEKPSVAARGKSDGEVGCSLFMRKRKYRYGKSETANSDAAMDVGVKAILDDDKYETLEDRHDIFGSITSAPAPDRYTSFIQYLL